MSSAVMSAPAVLQVPWLPPDNGLVAATGDLDAYQQTNSAVTAGAILLLKVPLRQPVTAGHVNLGLAVSGSGASTGCFVGVYDNTGKLLNVSADCAASFTAAAPAFLSIPMLAPLFMSAPFVWVAVVSNLATTQPAFIRNGGAGSLAFANGGLASASVLRYCANGSGTALPSNINPASNSGTNALPLWAGLSF